MAAEPLATPEPANRLAPQARLAWALSWALGCAVALVARQMAADPLPDGAATAILWLLVAALVIGTPLVSALRYRRWRWEVREREIDLQSGVLILRRTLIPMARVQHVTTQRGLVGQALGLASVTIHTAAGSHEIPMLRDADAAGLRERIATLARVDEEQDAPAQVETPDAEPQAAEAAEPDRG